MTIKLYPHNQNTYNNIQTMWKTTNRVAAVQATGTGKSFLILQCLFDIPNENKVVLAPTEYIFGQLIEHSEAVIPNVQFITYAKMSNMTDEEIQTLNPSLIVLDEFHRCGAEQWGKGVQKLLEIHSNAKVLGTSATPIRYLDNERNMGDEIFNGNLAVNLSLAEAIVKQILPMPKYISALYTFEEEIDNLKNKVVNSHNSEESKEEILKQIETMKHKLDKSKGIPNILQKYLTQNDGKFLVFCKNKEHLTEMKDTVIDWFKSAGLSNRIETYIVYTGYENTDKEFEAFRDNKDSESLKLMFSIEMLNEGIHVEDVTGVILLRPTTSPIIYYQQIGRAIDAGSDKEPLIFDFVNNFDNIGAKQFINDLKEFRQREIYSRKEYERKEYIDIPEFIVYDEVLEVKELFNNIEDKLIDNWDAMYEQLKSFYEEHSHSNVPMNYSKKQLSYWVSTQRKNYKNNLLQSDKIIKLQLLNFKWAAFDEKWESMYQELKSFKDKYGHINVTKNNSKLFNWIFTQKKYFKDGDLSKEKVEVLIALDNLILESKMNSWNDTFKEYKKYICDLKIERVTPKLNTKLYKWEDFQRRMKKEGKLSNLQIKLLNSINFVWNTVGIDDSLSHYHIKNLMIQNKLNTSQLSELISIKSPTIQNWRINRNNIPSNLIPSLARIFNIESELIEPQKRQ